MLYMVIFLISELYEELPYIFVLEIKREKKAGFKYYIPSALVNMSKGLNWNKRTKNGFMIHEGFITKSLPDGILRVRLENGDLSRFYFRKDST